MPALGPNRYIPPTFNYARNGEIPDYQNMNWNTMQQYYMPQQNNDTFTNQYMGNLQNMLAQYQGQRGSFGRQPTMPFQGQSPFGNNGPQQPGGGQGFPGSYGGQGQNPGGASGMIPEMQGGGFGGQKPGGGMSQGGGFGDPSQGGQAFPGMGSGGPNQFGRGDVYPGGASDPMQQSQSFGGGMGQMGGFGGRGSNPFVGGQFGGPGGGGYSGVNFNQQLMMQLLGGMSPQQMFPSSYGSMFGFGPSQNTGYGNNAPQQPPQNYSFNPWR